MKKILIFVILIILVIGATLIFDKDIFMKKEDKNIREPAVAGVFYPGIKQELESMIDEFMLETRLPTLGN